MNKKSTLIALNLFVLLLIVVSLYGFTKMYQSRKTFSNAENTKVRSDKYAYLTTSELQKLPGIPETVRILPTGKVKEFMLEAKPAKWEVLPGVKANALTYNGQSPGPVIRVNEGDLVRISLKNSLGSATSMHFHGMHLPNRQDGVPPYTQKSVEPGESFTYEFLAGHAGTYMYHPHINSVEQIDNGLYGAFVIDPQNSDGHLKYDKDYTMVLGGWNIPSDSFDKSYLYGEHTAVGHGNEQAADARLGSGTKDMQEMEGMEGMDKETDTMAMDYNFWTINGKAFPATETIKLKLGERVRLRLVNISNAAHPMHLHGTDFRIIAEDGHPLSSSQVVNTVNVAPGKIFDIDFIADNPGQWVFHCHELHHTENDGVEPGGLMMVFEVEGEASAGVGVTSQTNPHGGSKVGH